MSEIIIPEYLICLLITELTWLCSKLVHITKELFKHFWLPFKKLVSTLTLFTDPTSTSLINFETDTTVSATDCAYDHIVLKGDSLPSAANGGNVFNYQTFYDTDNILFEDQPITALISDHYPVEFNFS